ncbi:RNA polymerase sigma factor [Streptomyces millisiae]|uniref:Sigma-70 family RNA polymerase sigma factor n=1 Tax=Streptomyces millisiae TaxID=3075542 RepID=A0ABU2LM49_9ACTN|nr:sigma-70 family RNA polymerase sigma factor [Streptomyces sp. DSM 44918]MDT0318667.1 sigma-70 family RNA polymerase sigma factor [Streptomyces sp. DSM 44918]
MSDQHRPHDATDDTVLLARARGGDSAAFAELYRRHAGPVRLHARGAGLTPQAADDVTGEAFARTLKAVREGGGPRSSVRGYLLAMVRRMAAGRRAPAPLPSDLPSPLPSAESQALHRAERVMLAEAFATLPERWREVLWRTAVEGQPLAEVGRDLGLTKNATAVLAFRAREGLRQAYLQAHVSDALTDQRECRRYSRRLGSFIRGSAAARGLRQHLDGCDRCRAAYLELVDVNAALRGLLPVAAAGLVARVAPWSALPAWSAGGAAGKVAIAATFALVVGPAVPAVGDEPPTAPDDRRPPVAAPEPTAEPEPAPPSPTATPTDPAPAATGPSATPSPSPTSPSSEPTGLTGLLCLIGGTAPTLLSHPDCPPSPTADVTVPDLLPTPTEVPTPALPEREREPEPEPETDPPSLSELLPDGAPTG